MRKNNSSSIFYRKLTLSQSSGANHKTSATLRGTLSEGLLVLEGWREPAVSLVFLPLSPDISLSPRLGGRHSSSHNEALGPFSSPAGPNMAGICEDTVLDTLSPRDKAGTEFSWISASHALSLSRHPSLRGAAPELCLHTRPGVKLPPGEDPGLALHQADPFAPLLHQECFLFSCKKNCFCSPTVFQLRPAKDNASSQLPSPPFI